MTKEEELSKYIAQIEQYKEQINQLEMQSSYIQGAILDYNKAKMTLENLNNADKDNDVLIPIGGSTFINAKAADTSKVLFDIGSGIVSEKNYEDAIKKIDERIEDLQKTQESIVSMVQKLQNEAEEISLKAQKIYQDQKE